LIGQSRSEAQVNAKPVSSRRYQSMADIDVFGAPKSIEDQVNGLSADLSRECTGVDVSETSDRSHPGTRAPSALAPGSVEQLVGFVWAEVFVEHWQRLSRKYSG